MNIIPTATLKRITTFHVDRYTKGGSDAANTVVYATILNWPMDGNLKLGSPQLVKESTVTLLGHSQDLQVQN